MAMGGRGDGGGGDGGSCGGGGRGSDAGGDVGGGAVGGGSVSSSESSQSAVHVKKGISMPTQTKMHVRATLIPRKRSYSYLSLFDIAHSSRCTCYIKARLRAETTTLCCGKLRVHLRAKARAHAHLCSRPGPRSSNSLRRLLSSCLGGSTRGSRRRARARTARGGSSPICAHGLRTPDWAVTG